MASALSTPIFELTRSSLNTFDDNIEPLCKYEIFALPPRIVQVVANTLGLVAAVGSSAFLGVASALSLPQSMKNHVVVWKKDAWTLIQLLIDKLAHLVIALIPFAGTKILAEMAQVRAVNGRLEQHVVDLVVENEAVRRRSDDEQKMVQSLRRQLEAAQVQQEDLRNEFTAVRAEAIAQQRRAVEFRAQLEVAQAEAQQAHALREQVDQFEQIAAQLREEAEVAQNEVASEKRRAQKLAAQLEIAQGEVQRARELEALLHEYQEGGQARREKRRH